jgi:hypothetical protein
MLECLHTIWQYSKAHDASNWFVILVSLLIWPTILSVVVYWRANRKRQSAPHFLVTFTPYQIQIGTAPHDAVALTFINQTGSIVYLSRARLTEVKKRFPIPVAASRDMARGWRELVFALPSNPTNFDHYECILQTDAVNGRAIAAIAVKQEMDEDFYSYHPAMLRRCFRCPKYFLLEYVVVIGEKKFSVATVY